MFEVLNEIELLNCHIEKRQRATILTTSKNGNAYKVFINQQNALGLHTQRAGGVLYVHKCTKVVVRVIHNSFCTGEVQVGVSSDNSSEGIGYMDPISKVFYRNFTITNCNP